MKKPRNMMSIKKAMDKHYMGGEVPHKPGKMMKTTLVKKTRKKKP